MPDRYGGSKRDLAGTKWGPRLVHPPATFRSWSPHSCGKIKVSSAPSWVLMVIFSAPKFSPIIYCLRGGQLSGPKTHSGSPSQEPIDVPPPLCPRPQLNHLFCSPSRATLTLALLYHACVSSKNTPPLHSTFIAQLRCHPCHPFFEECMNSPRKH